MVVANRLSEPFRKQLALCGGRGVEVEPGVLRVEGLMFPLVCVETEHEEDHLLHLFSYSFVRRPARAFSLLNEEERDIFAEVYNTVEAFKNDPRSPMRFVDFADFTMSMQEFLQHMLKRLSPEELAKHLSAEDRLRGLPPEDRLRCLPPEDLVNQLTSEDVAKRLSPEAKERLRCLLDN